MKRAALLALVLAVLASCGEDEELPRNTDTDEPSTSIQVTASDFAFEPNAFEVLAGADITIEFDNEDSTSHSFTAPTAHVEVVLEPGGTGAGGFQAEEIGTIEFFCKFHPDDMTGTIEVTES